MSCAKSLARNGISKSMIKKLELDEIFVFGSNALGMHEGGAARQAHEQFGAEWGIGEGLTGQCYAIPTLDEHMNRVHVQKLIRSIIRLKKCCEENLDKKFLLTKVGCGIAGFDEDKIKSLFNEHGRTSNLEFPIGW